MRAEGMAAAARQGSAHGMLSVAGLLDEQLQGICEEVKAKLGGDTVCQLANFLFPQVGLSGDQQGSPGAYDDSGTNHATCGHNYLYADHPHQ